MYDECGEWDEYKSKWWNIPNKILVWLLYSVAVFTLLIFPQFLGYIFIGSVFGVSIYIAIQQYCYRQKLVLIINKKIEEKEKDEEIKDEKK